MIGELEVPRLGLLRLDLIVIGLMGLTRLALVVIGLMGLILLARLALVLTLVGNRLLRRDGIRLILGLRLID